MIKKAMLLGYILLGNPNNTQSMEKSCVHIAMEKFHNAILNYRQYEVSSKGFDEPWSAFVYNAPTFSREIISGLVQVQENDSQETKDQCLGMLCVIHFYQPNAYWEDIRNGMMGLIEKGADVNLEHKKIGGILLTGLPLYISVCKNDLAMSQLILNKNGRTDFVELDPEKKEKFKKLQ